MSADVLRRILIRANDDSAGPNTLFLFDEALADAERRGRRQMVERIQERLAAKRDRHPSIQPVRWGFLELEIRAILDEEAAR